MRHTLLLALALGTLPVGLGAQETAISALASVEGDAPRRLAGYGLVVGLPGTGDQTGYGARGSAHTVLSVANLLERFGVRVPAAELQTRNVAAVLVTAEVSGYARPGARFDVQVSSIGDARSIEGGVLWMTPLMEGPESEPVALAQGVLERHNTDARYAFSREGRARLSGGGILEAPLSGIATVGRDLRLHRPDFTVASAIAARVNEEMGAGTAAAVDPGTVRLTIPDGANAVDVVARIGALEISLLRRARIVVDARSGAVTTGGNVRVGPGSVTYRDVTLTISGTGAAAVATAPVEGTQGDAPVMASVAVGTSVEDVVSALTLARARPADIGQILLALAAAGVIEADVEVR